MAATSSAIAQTKLVYSTWASEDYPTAIAVRSLFERAMKASNGQLAFDAHYGGAVTPIRTTLPSLRDKLVDIAHTTGSIFPGELPLDALITDHATVQGSVYALNGAINELMLLECAGCKEEAQKAGVRPLAYLADAPYYLQCREAFSTLDDLRGKQIRGFGAFALLPQSMGAVPVSTAPAELFEALQKGAVSCAIGGGFWQKTYSLWDLTKHVVDMPLGQYNNGGVLTFNRSSFDRLTPAQKKAVTDNLAHLVRVGTEAALAQDREVREGSQQRKVNWAKPFDAFAKHVQDFNKNEPQRVIADAEKRKVAGAADTIKAYERLIEKWKGLTADIGNDGARYEALLQREIFDKVAWN